MIRGGRSYSMQSNSRNALLIISLVVLVGIGIYSAPMIAEYFSPEPEPEYRFGGMELVPPRTAPELDHIDQDGQPYRLGDQLGKAVLVFFGYANCPDVCPTTLYDFTRVKQQLGSLADRVEFLFITVDGERDTPEVLKQYVESFDPQFKGLWADQEATQRIAHQYNIYYEFVDAPDSSLGYTVDHTSIVYMIDPAGQLRSAYFFGTTPDRIVRDIEHVITQYDAKLPPVEIEAAWARPAAAGGNSALYFTINNTGSRSLRLVDARTSAANTVEIHETTFETEVVNGQPMQTMHMHQVDSIEVPRRQKVELQPGGLHIMLLDLPEALAVGDTIVVSLEFEGYSPIRLDVPVQQGGDDHDHDHHHH